MNTVSCYLLSCF